MEKKPKGPRPFTPEELQRFRKFREEHEQRMATDPEYKREMEEAEKFISAHVFPNDSIEEETKTQEQEYLMESVSGKMVWVPESRLEAWLEDQETQKAGRTEILPNKQQSVDRIVQRILSAKS